MYGSLPLLCNLLSLSESELVQRRALFAISALLRGNSKEQVNFIKSYRGLRILGESFAERSPQVQLKAAVLLTDLLNDEVIATLMYDIDTNSISNQAWCLTVLSMLES